MRRGDCGGDDDGGECNGFVDFDDDCDENLSGNYYSYESRSNVMI